MIGGRTEGSHVLLKLEIDAKALKGRSIYEPDYKSIFDRLVSYGNTNWVGVLNAPADILFTLSGRA